MGRRRPRTQMQKLRSIQGKVEKDREKWKNGLITRQECADLIVYHLARHVEIVAHNRWYRRLYRWVKRWSTIAWVQLRRLWRR